MRIRKKKWAIGEMNDNPKVLYQPENFRGQWKNFFDNNNPIHLELGCGKGKFINTMSMNNPGVNFLAIEKYLHIIAMGVRTANLNNVSNLFFINEDVNQLADFFDENEIQKIYINFCDPWPKKKHAKRRLTNMHFLNLYKKVLDSSCGQIQFKTDNKDLFEYSLEQFQENSWKLSEVTFDLHNSDFVGNVMTEYEQKFSSIGTPICRLCASVH